MLAFRRAATVATVAAAGEGATLANTLLHRAQRQQQQGRAMGGGGVVAGQDTPLQHKEDLPEHLKKEFSHVTEHPRTEGGAAGGAAAPASSAGGAAGGEQAGVAPHPDEMADPYSGADPSQKEGAGST